jgi:hypothetical protein
MDTLLKGLFGGDDDDEQRRSRARDFVDRYETGNPWEGFSGQEAYDNYGRVSRQAPPEVYERAAEQTFNRMSPSQRSEFAQMMQQQMGGGGRISDDPRQLAQSVSRMQQEKPGILESLFGGGDNRSFGSGSSGSSGGGGIGGLLDNPLAKVALGGIAAFAFKEMIDRDGGGKKRKVVV